MAQLDTSIITEGAKNRMMLPHEVAQVTQDLQRGKMQNAMMGAQMQDRVAAQQGKQRLNALYKQYGGDLDKMMQSGELDMDTAMQLSSMQGEQAKLQGQAAKENAQADKARIEAGIQKLNYGSQLLQGATPQNWQNVREEMIQLTGKDFGENYDPNTVQTLIRQGLSVKDQLANEWKQKGYELDVAQFGEQRRHNMAQEGISASRAGESQQKPIFDSARGILINPATGEASPVMSGGSPIGSKPSTSSNKPMPTAALKMQQESLDAIGTAGAINADLGAVKRMIEGGDLDFGPISNIKNQALNTIGASTEQSRNFSTFKATLEKLRNDSLRLNKGVQTDGDAQRAWNELFQNINDKELVKQRLSEIERINERGAELQRMNVDQIRSNYGLAPLDVEDRYSQPSALGSSRQLSGRDDEAAAWANANPNDPRAAAIRQRLGM